MLFFPAAVAFALSACSESASAPLAGPGPQTEQTSSAADSTPASHSGNSTVTTSVQPSGPSGHWNMIFSDEFSKSGVDTSKWHTSYWWGGIKGAEQQEYVPQGVEISDGIAHLTAKPRPGNAHPYTSGMLATWGKLDLTRGTVIEARVKAPHGVGLWPAIWLHASSGGWPPEIDVLEVRGFDPATWLLSDHWADETGAHQSQGFRPKDDAYAEGYHTVTMLWDSTQVTWYIDGVQKATITDPEKIPNEPMYLIVNLAIGGGGWPGAPDSTTAFPSSFDVDYVRVWRTAP